uniref:Uncharacterized protein n=1 Tax=Rhizophora mucronata TaxID=61149 RepID=A0A2P2M3B6_RHIMU
MSYGVIQMLSKQFCLPFININLSIRSIMKICGSEDYWMLFVLPLWTLAVNTSHENWDSSNLKLCSLGIQFLKWVYSTST